MWVDELLKIIQLEIEIEAMKNHMNEVEAKINEMQVKMSGIMQVKVQRVNKCKHYVWVVGVVIVAILGIVILK